MPADDHASAACAAGPAAAEATTDDPSDAAVCADGAAQYQPEEPQYQAPTPTICGASAEAVAPIEPIAPITEPEVSVPSTTATSDVAAPPAVVSPTSQPIAPPAVVSPTTEPTRSGADVLPASDGWRQATTKIAASRPVPRWQSRPSAGSLGQAVRTERVIPAHVQAKSETPQERPRPVRVPRTKPATPVFRSKVESAGPPTLESASSRMNLFGSWLVFVLPLSFAFGLAMLLFAGASAARSLRARVRSKGLTNDAFRTRSSGGIRYRE